MGGCVGLPKKQIVNVSKLTYENMKICENEVLKLMNIPTD